MKMANFDNGVKAYIYGECIVKVHFPVDWNNNVDVCCYQCNMFSRNTGVCQLTKEISEYPTKHRGSKCPLVFDGEIFELKGEKENESN
jgi:hypothetical protein